MKKERLSVDQIVCHLFDMEGLLAQGLPVDEACRKIGISEKNYQRWHRMYGGQKPAHVKCMEAFEASDKSGDVTEMLAKFSELQLHQSEGRAPRGVGFVLARKLSILTQVKSMCASMVKKPTARTSREVWERPEAGSDVVQNKVHEVIVDEFSKMIRFYMNRTKKNNQPVNANMVTNISVEMKGDVGKQVSAALLSYFTGYELPSKLHGQLEDGWRKLGAHIELLARSAKIPQ